MRMFVVLFVGLAVVTLPACSQSDARVRSDNPAISAPPTTEELPSAVMDSDTVAAKIGVETNGEQPRQQLVVIPEFRLTDEERAILGDEPETVDLLEFYRPLNPDLVYGPAAPYRIRREGTARALHLGPNGTSAWSIYGAVAPAGAIGNPATKVGVADVPNENLGVREQSENGIGETPASRRYQKYDLD